MSVSVVAHPACLCHPPSTRSPTGPGQGHPVDMLAREDRRVIGPSVHESQLQNRERESSRTELLAIAIAVPTATTTTTTTTPSPLLCICYASLHCPHQTCAQLPPFKTSIDRTPSATIAHQCQPSSSLSLVAHFCITPTHTTPHHGTHHSLRHHPVYPPQALPDRLCRHLLPPLRRRHLCACSPYRERKVKKS